MVRTPSTFPPRQTGPHSPPSLCETHLTAHHEHNSAPTCAPPMQAAHTGPCRNAGKATYLQTCNKLPEGRVCVCAAVWQRRARANTHLATICTTHGHTDLPTANGKQKQHAAQSRTVSTHTTSNLGAHERPPSSSTRHWRHHTPAERRGELATQAAHIYDEACGSFFWL